MRQCARGWTSMMRRAETAGRRWPGSVTRPVLSGTCGRDSGLGKNLLALIGAKEYYS